MCTSGGFIVVSETTFSFACNTTDENLSKTASLVIKVTIFYIYYYAFSQHYLKIVHFFSNISNINAKLSPSLFENYSWLPGIL